MWLADEDRLAAELMIKARQRAGAIDQALAPLHHDVGIGADHRQSSSHQPPEERAVILGRLGVVIEKPGAAHQLRFHLADKLGIEPGVETEVALVAHMKELYPWARSDHHACHVAG